MPDHIKEGREKLNYSLWDGYVGSEAAGENGGTVQEAEMPPAYYRFMHSHGDPTAPKKQQLIAWFNGATGGEGRTGGGAEEEGEEDNDPSR